jgi:DNA-binding response OmpR family regulator
MNVLIIEDDMEHAQEAAAMIRRLGWRCQVNKTGASGLDAAGRSRPDLVLLDMDLYDVDGFEVCRKLRADPRTSTIPVIMVTSLDDSGYRRRGFRVGANGYLTKPYAVEELAGVVRAARSWRDGLEQRRVRHEVALELDSHTAYLLDVDNFFAELCRQTPLSHEQVIHLRQAFLEIGQNAIEWGNQMRPDKAVRVLFRAYQDRVEVVVRDEGAGFDPEHLPHAASSDDPLAHIDVRERLGLREGGFGLLIARGLVDELRQSERGNVITLIKRFDSPTSESSSDPSEIKCASPTSSSPQTRH